MGGVLFGVVGSLRTLVRRPALTGKEGQRTDGEGDPRPLR
jgi:hypothetical protein